MRIQEAPHGRTYAAPLLLISEPGASEDLFFFDDEALAPWLARQGWRVYAVGLTDPTSGQSHDIGALVSFVQADAGTAPVVIAQGLAGSAVYEWLAGAGAERPRLRGLITLGAPWRFVQPSDLVRALALRGRDAQEPIDVSAAHTTRAFFSHPDALPMPEPPEATVLELLLAGHGISRERALRAFAAAAQPLPPALAHTLAQRALDGSVPTAERIRVGAPVFLIAGSADVVAPPRSVLSVREQLDAPRVDYRKIGRLDLARSDYAHLALVAGDRAPREVFVPLQKWLEAEVAPR